MLTDYQSLLTNIVPFFRQGLENHQRLRRNKSAIEGKKSFDRKQNIRKVQSAI